MSQISLKSKMGHALREAILHTQRWVFPDRAKRMVMFPCGDTTLSSSRERVYNLGKYLRQIGWRVTIVPVQLELEQRHRLLALEKPDILFIQKARHPLNFPQLYRTSHIVFDLDDADFLAPYQTQQIADCCRGSELVICGSQYVANYCRQYNSNVRIVWTGIDLKQRNYLPSSQRQPIVAWGTSDAVIYGKEREFLVEVMLELRRRIDFEFWIYGVSDLQAIAQDIEQLKRNQIRTKLFSLLPLARYHQSLERVAVGLQPVLDTNPYSMGKSFGKVNSYMQCGVPIIVQNRLDYPNFFQDGHNGMLADNLEGWVSKIERLLSDPALRDALADRASIDLERRLSTSAIAQQMDRILTDLIISGTT